VTYGIADCSHGILAPTLRQNSRRGFCKKERKEKKRKGEYQETSRK
jgi:hypothetical protein